MAKWKQSVYTSFTTLKKKPELTPLNTGYSMDVIKTLGSYWTDSKITQYKYLVRTSSWLYQEKAFIKSTEYEYLVKIQEISLVSFECVKK